MSGREALRAPTPLPDLPPLQEINLERCSSLTTLPALSDLPALQVWSSGVASSSK